MSEKKNGAINDIPNGITIWNFALLLHVVALFQRFTLHSIAINTE